MMPDLLGIRQRLAVYLGAEIEYLRVLGSGWETTIYEFAIGGRSPETPELPVRAPLVLRLYDGVAGDDKSAREARTIFALAGAGYPVPRPYLCEHEHEALGAPFIVMDRVTGGPLFSAKSLPIAFKTFSLGFIAFVRAQVRLHRMDLRHPRLPGQSDFASKTMPAGAKPFSLGELPRAYTSASIPAIAPLLDRLLAILAERIESGPLPGLRNALDRLRERAERYRIAPDALVHMDYHPQNVVVRGLRVTGVIDWVSADRGDRHLDAATTSVILATSAMDRPRWMRDNPIGNSLRTLFAALYFPTYHALAPMELDRFRYCQAVAATFRLSTFGMMRIRGPESVGLRPEAIANITPDVLRLLSRYASRKSRTPTTIEVQS